MSTRYDERRALAERILKRIAGDPSFGSQVLADPHAALRAAGFGSTAPRMHGSGEQTGEGYAASLRGESAHGDLPPCLDSGPGPSLACFIFSWCL